MVVPASRTGLIERRAEEGRWSRGGAARTAARSRHPAVKPTKWAMSISAVMTAIAGLVAGASAQTMQIERYGPWAFTQQLEPGTNTPRQMATTAAAEDASIWLLLVCSKLQLTASLMHTARFPYAVSPTLKLLLHADGFPMIAVTAQRVQENQLTIDAAMTSHILPLIIGSERIVVSMTDNEGGAHGYTFSLQPNGVALAGIARHCLNDER
jgi:hypothetical protein